MVKDHFGKFETASLWHDESVWVGKIHTCDGDQEAREEDKEQINSEIAHDTKHSNREANSLVLWKAADVGRQSDAKTTTSKAR
jgi:hypothetical protein